MSKSAFAPALLVALTLAWPAIGAAQPRPEDPVPVDPALRILTLENGLTVYLRANGRPENRAELRLVVNAGSVLEDEDQRGLAHFLEHMAFNGTKNFPKNELIDFLESIGSRFGPDLNAYTSFDETVYMLTIPTDKPGLLDRGLQVLRDWAGDMTLSDEEIERERGVVLEEWRLGQGAQERLRKVHWPVLFRGSRYAERLPIGAPEIIERGSAERLRDFYRTWYRPDLMALVAVGTFDVDSLETRVRALFSDLPAGPADRGRPTFDVPRHPGLVASAAVDPEQSVTQVWTAFKMPREETGTFRAYRRMITGFLAVGLLNERLTEIAKKPNPPFRFASASAGSPVRTLDMFSLFAFPEEGETEQGLRAVLTELARVRRHGFTDTELDRLKSTYLAAMERAYRERDKTDSDAFTGEYVRHFLEGEPAPGIEAEYEIANRLIPEITLAEVDAVMRDFDPMEDAVVLASGPEKSDAPLPEVDALVAAAREALSAETDPYVDEVSDGALLAEMPAPGRVVAREYRADLGLTAVAFANGVEAWIKPTDFKNDQIVFSAIARGGTSLADSMEFLSASLAGSVVAEGGVGGHSSVALQKLLAGKLVQVGPQIGDFTHGIQGSSTPGDLETALQLVHLHFTAPNRDHESFTVLMDRLRTFLRNRDTQPEARFNDRIAVVNHRNHYMYRPWTLERLDEVDLDTALEFYRSLYADASDYRFYIVGAVEVDEAIPLLARYLGSLPSRRDGASDFRDPQLSFPAGTVRETVRAGQEEKARARITWNARASMDEEEMFLLRMANLVLEIRLRELLREDQGGTYSVGVGYDFSAPYPGYAATVATFGCAPDNVDTMVRDVFAEIARFKSSGPTKEEVEKVKELERRSVETRLRENGYWLASLQTVHLLGWPAERVLARMDRIDAITADALRAVFSLYYPEDNYTVITLLPEAGAE